MWWALAIACHSPTVDTPSTSPVLTVEHGYGSGTYADGTVVHVWADVDPSAAIVADWSGGSVDPSGEWNGDVTMPAHDLTLSADELAVSAPITEATITLAAGPRTVLEVLAPEPKGLVLFFHGASFSVDQLRSNAAHTLTLQFVHAGYSVVAMPSEAEVAAGTGGWNPSLDADNPDLKNVAALIAAIGPASGTPVIAWGMSSGGQFAHAVGADELASIVIAFCAPGSASTVGVTTAATMWSLAGNDQTFPTGVADATALQAGLASRHIRNDLFVHPPTPLYDERFVRVGGVDGAHSAAIAASLRAHGAVDANNQWLVTGSAAISLPLDGLDGLDGDQLKAVNAEIEILAADHQLYDDDAARVLAFVEGS